MTVAARVVSTQSQPSLTLSRLAPIGLVVGESFLRPIPPQPIPHRAYSAPHRRACHLRNPFPPPSSPIASSSFGSAFKPVSPPWSSPLSSPSVSAPQACAPPPPRNAPRTQQRHHHHHHLQAHHRRRQPLHVTSCSELVGVVVVATAAGGGGIGSSRGWRVGECGPVGRC